MKLGTQVRELYSRLPRMERIFAGMPPYSSDVDAVLRGTRPPADLPSRDKIRVGFVCEDPHVIGYTQATVSHATREIHWRWLFVDPQRRGEGIAGRLFSQVRQYQDAFGYPIVGDVLHNNARMRAVLEHYGFSHTKTWVPRTQPLYRFERAP